MKEDKKENKRYKLGVFLVVIFVILYFANLVVYEALVFGLKISRPSYVLIGILGILGLSFIASTFLGMRAYNYFTRAYYVVSMVWIGLFGYFFIASILFLLEFFLTRNTSELSVIIFFGAAIVAGIYGILHARKIYIKKIDVEMKDLPDAWRGRKAVWISDIHVGQVNGKKYIERLVRKINNISPDIIFIGGDLFDGSSAKGITDCISPMMDLSAPLGKYFVSGNHEGYGDSNSFMKKISEVGIQILNNKKVVIDGIQIAGVDFLSTENRNNLKSVLESLSIDKSMLSILLKHEPSNLDVAVEAGILFQISGHTHKAQQWPFEYLACISYGRLVYGLNKFKKMLVYTSSGVGTWGPPIRVGTNSEIVVFSFAEEKVD